LTSTSARATYVSPRPTELAYTVLGSPETPSESACDIVSTPIACVPAAQRIVRENMRTVAPLTLPLKKVWPYAPAPSPVTSSHVANAGFLYVIAASVTASHASAGKTSLNLPTSTCRAASVAPPVCVFIRIDTSKAPRPSLALGGMKTSS